MLEQLRICDFQGHKVLSVKLDPHVTAIVGPTDSGKSAILRALRWLATNRPSGEEFIRHGSDATSVLLNVDGREVHRTRGKGANRYKLDDKVLEAFGAGVPAEVLGLLNLGELNFQGQHDAPFWFSESAGEVSRQLNAIINLGVIDTTLANLNGRVRHNQTALNVCQERLREAKDRRDQLKGVVLVDCELEEVEALEVRAREQRTIATQCETAYRDGQNYAQRVEHTAKALRAAKTVVQKGEVWAEVERKRSLLAQLVASARAQQVKAHRVLPDLQPLEELAQQEGVAAIRHGKLALLLRDAHRLQTMVDEATRQRVANEKALTNALGAECPLCGSRIQAK